MTVSHGLRRGSKVVASAFAWVFAFLTVASCTPFTPYYRKVSPEDWRERKVNPVTLDVYINFGCLCVREELRQFDPGNRSLMLLSIGPDLGPSGIRNSGLLFHWNYDHMSDFVPVV